MVHIVATASGFPPYYYRQEEICSMLSRLWANKLTNPGRLEKFHRNVMVEGRYLAQPLETYLEETGFGERNGTWIQTALELGEQVICDLLDQEQLQAEAVSHIAFTTVTGIAVPSIDARLMNRIPFSRSIKRTPLFGWGCMGGAAGIARLADYLSGHPQEAAILLSIELCSLTIQHSDLSIENLISSALFGDGAAAVLMAGSEHPLASPGQPRVMDSLSVFFPDTEHVMGWEMRDTGFKMLLSADVADIVEGQLRPAVESFLGTHELTIADISYWIAHPGGPKVMQAIEEGLGLDDRALQLSRESLAAVGNLSSASVLLILQETLARNQPEPGAYGLLMAMGPAFSAELVLLQW